MIFNITATYKDTAFKQNLREIILQIKYIELFIETDGKIILQNTYENKKINLPYGVLFLKWCFAGVSNRKLELNRIES